jgi:hypothetical protein
MMTFMITLSALSVSAGIHAPGLTKSRRLIVPETVSGGRRWHCHPGGGTGTLAARMVVWRLDGQLLAVVPAGLA